MNISVLMCLYNPGSKARVAVDSVIRQTFRPAQVVIVDDGSNDREAPFAHQKLLDAGLNSVLIQNKRNMGLTRALNVGLRHCSGDLIARIDADDLWLPTHLSTAISIFSLRPDACLVGFRAPQLGKWYGRVPKVYGSISRRTDSKTGVYGLRMVKRMELFARNPFSHSSIVFKRIIEGSEIRYDESYRVSQDYALYASFIVRKFNMINSHAKTCVVARHTKGSISALNTKSQLLNSIRIKRSMAQGVWWGWARFFVLKEYVMLMKVKINAPS